MTDLAYYQNEIEELQGSFQIPTYNLRGHVSANARVYISDF